MKGRRAKVILTLPEMQTLNKKEWDDMQLKIVRGKNIKLPTVKVEVNANEPNRNRGERHG